MTNPMSQLSLNTAQSPVATESGTTAALPDAAAEAVSGGFEELLTEAAGEQLTAEGNPLALLPVPLVPVEKPSGRLDGKLLPPLAADGATLLPGGVVPGQGIALRTDTSASISGQTEGLMLTAGPVSGSSRQQVALSASPQLASAVPDASDTSDMQTLMAATGDSDGDSAFLERSALTAAQNGQEIVGKILRPEVSTAQLVQTSPSNASILPSVQGPLELTSPNPATGNAAPIQVTPQNPQWGQALGERVQWLVSQNLQEAEIRLNPPELGMLEVKVALGGDKHTSISFSSPHAQVRDAIEAAIPRLREMFGEAGMSLDDVNVSQQSLADQRQAGSGEGEHTGEAKDGVDPENEQTAELSTGRTHALGIGLLDTYA